MAVVDTSLGPQAEAGWTSKIVFITILSLAFNDLKPLLPVGEMASDCFVYTVPILLLCLLRHPGKIEMPVVLTTLVAAFGVVLVVGVLLNYSEIAEAYYKGRSGMSRVFTQGIAVGFGLLMTFVAYNLTRRGFLPLISRAAQVVLVIMASVGVLEIASWSHIPGLTQLYDALSLIIHSGSKGDYPNRLRMTAFEVSWAGVMLSFFFPFSLIRFDVRSWRLPALMIAVLIMTFLAQSRTALLVILSQMLTLTWLMLRRRFDVLVGAAAVLAVGVFVLMLSPSIQEKIGTVGYNMIRYGGPSAPQEDLRDENISNVTRLAAIRAGISIFRDNPVFGAGLGQYGFKYPGHLRAEDFRSWEVRMYTTDGVDPWPPSFSLHARLLSETGVIGYAIWLSMLLIAIGRSATSMTLNNELGRAHLAVTLTIAGWLLIGTSIDSFRFLGGWMAIGIAFALPRRPVEPA